MKTADDFKQAVEDRGITKWPVHDCSICGYPCGYIFQEGLVGYDSGCDCVNYTNIQLRSYEDVAEFYNRQTHPDYVAIMNKFWFPTEETVLDNSPVIG